LSLDLSEIGTVRQWGYINNNKTASEHSSNNNSNKSNLAMKQLMKYMCVVYNMVSDNYNINYSWHCTELIEIY